MQEYSYVDPYLTEVKKELDVQFMWDYKGTDLYLDRKTNGVIEPYYGYQLNLPLDYEEEVKITGLLEPIKEQKLLNK